MKVIGGLVDCDGMCRPWQYNLFVFVDGAFAGTISPEPVVDRYDGSGRVLSSFPSSDGTVALTAGFARYTERDPLCCPSTTSDATYRIDHVDGKPVLVLTSVTTPPSRL